MAVHLDHVSVYDIGKEFLQEQILDAEMGMAGGIAVLLVALPAAVLYGMFHSTNHITYCQIAMIAYALHLISHNLGRFWHFKSELRK